MNTNTPQIHKGTWQGLTWFEFEDTCAAFDAFLTIAYSGELYRLWEGGASPRVAIEEIERFAAHYRE